MSRIHYLPAPIYRDLDRACVPIRQAFGVPYLVGSATKRPDYRDIDLRVIMPDDEFLGLFPGRCDPAARMESNMRWSIVCSLISRMLCMATGLPVDFQIQSQTQANAENDGHRIPLGIVPTLPDDPRGAPSPAVVGGPGGGPPAKEEPAP